MNENYEYPIHLMSFWAINDCLELGKLKKQLLELKEAGLSGVVFHPRDYVIIIHCYHQNIISVNIDKKLEERK